MELAYCVPLGIPHSTFLGWSTDDQDKALAWRAEQAQACPRCHTRPDEWDPARGGRRDAFYAEAVRCLGCETLQQAEREMTSGSGPAELGVSLVLLPNDSDDEGEED